MAVLARITLYPIKALDGVAAPQAEFTAAGGLVYDRRFALLDDKGVVINGKREPLVYRLRAEYDLEGEIVRLRVQGESQGQAFSLAGDRRELTAYLSDFFGRTVTIVENREGGFPDDNAAPGPTVVAAQTLQEVARWFDLPLDETRRRFRANLEIDADAPFWEDRLFRPGPSGVPFQIGVVSLVGTNPCARCVVPSRSADFGEPTAHFAKTFAQRRAETLPAWAARDRFDHFYRLAVNTRVVSPAADAVRVGQAVRIDAHNSPEAPHVSEGVPR